MSGETTVFRCRSALIDGRRRRSGDFQNPADGGQGGTPAEQAQPETATVAWLTPDLFVRDVLQHHEDLTGVFVSGPGDVFRALAGTYHHAVVVVQVSFDANLRHPAVCSEPPCQGSTYRKSSVGGCG